MEAQKVKYPLEKMKYLAEDVVRLLRPYCTRIEIAGSIRRKRSEVSDIEIVCIPKTMMVPTLDLLDPLKEVRMPGFVNAVDAYKKVKGDAAAGKYFQRILPDGIKLDIFTATRDNWGYILVLRTGGETFNKFLMGPNGFPAHGYKCVGGQIVRSCDHVVMPCYEEGDVFKLLKMEYRRPEYRT
jgi:DNA polymerase/3'-5' exonuclease PolX